MQIAQRLNKIHPDKLLGTLQSHIDDGHEQSALQAIPDLQIGFPQFQNELEQIKSKLSAKLRDDVKIINPQSASVFNCVNCGGGLAKQCRETVHVICHYCGHDAEHPANDIQLDRWNKALDLEANFTIGDFFQYQGAQWQAVGVQLFSGRVREYDSEDGWESSFSRYTSWWMLNEQRELAWLIDDGSRRYWAEKYLPQNPSVPESKDRNFEHGEWELEFAAGEFSYQPLYKEQHHSAESRTSSMLPVTSATDTASSKQRYYTSVERRINAQGEVSEIEFIKSRMIPHAEVLSGLGKVSALEDRQRWRNSMRLLFVALPLLAATALMLNRGGDTSLETVAIAKNDKQVLMQEIKIDEPGQVLKLRGSLAGLRDNSWFGVDVGLQSSDNEVVYSKYLEFWRESGRDSDGPWSEADLSSSWFIRVDEPDTYTVVIDGDEQSTSSTADFRLHTERNKTSLMPFMLAAVFSLFLIMMCKSKMGSVSAAASSIALKLNQRYLGGKDNNRHAHR